MSSKFSPPSPKNRQKELTQRRNLKMAHSAHAYVRGSTVKFYEWLSSSNAASIPQGPPVWICGDCHLGNLGPIANSDGRVEIQIRDLDQTVIGNPAHDLIRLSLSLASAARSSDLPGVITAKMLEALMEGYISEFTPSENSEKLLERPVSVQVAMENALKRTWKHLADDHIKHPTLAIPLGHKFWPLSSDESKEIRKLFKTDDVRKLVTSLKSRGKHDTVHLLDAAFWMKGCSSLGNLRYAVLLGVGKPPFKSGDLCLIDIKEAVKAAVPRTDKKPMPRDNAERVIKGARALSPFLGKRMLATSLMEKKVFLRELLPQDLKLEIENLTPLEATSAARFLAAVVGKAHARQMTEEERQVWLTTLKQGHTKSLEAPSWLWSAIVDLLTTHEAAYLEHCRKYAFNQSNDVS